MTFTIYDDSTGGNPLWTETHSSVEVIEGLFSVILGTFNAASDTICYWPERWLSIEIGDDPEIEPRTRLVSAPYAIQAAYIDGFHAGPNNVDSGQYTVVAGDSNSVLSDYSSVTGGQNNVAGTVAKGGSHSHVGGGYNNKAEGNYSTVCAGRDNQSNGVAATIGGGYSHSASGDYTFIGGGYDNYAPGYCSIIPGGWDCIAYGDYSFTAGRRAKTSYNGCFVWADNHNSDYNAGRDDQFAVRAYGGARFDIGSSAFVEMRNTSYFINTSTGAYLSSGGVWTDSKRDKSKTKQATLDSRTVLSQLLNLNIVAFVDEETGERHINPLFSEFVDIYDVGLLDEKGSVMNRDWPPAIWPV